MERIIEIKSLEVITSIGVSKEEQAMKQQLLCDLRFTACTQQESLEDELSATIDYVAISRCVQEVASEAPRKLLETLADDITKFLILKFEILWIELTLQKFILPNTKYVAVSVRRERGSLL
ncbi:MAG: dihydroneopterin aldolase [Verrucomicrobia bacterium]|jgi:dihydroneopterin aldolase|nr:MAG: dihydroneopterin aldolase [Verrucomicrobiota bacterium]MDH4470330.1 dihydroneopterin aldolase [Verrucomicrobiae bacterium]